MSMYEAQVIAKEKNVTNATIMEEALERWIAFCGKKLRESQKWTLFPTVSTQMQRCRYNFWYSEYDDREAIELHNNDVLMSLLVNWLVQQMQRKNQTQW